jgi:flagellar biosynthesis protein FliQ
MNPMMYEGEWTPLVVTIGLIIVLLTLFIPWLVKILKSWFNKILSYIKQKKNKIFMEKD